LVIVAFIGVIVNIIIGAVEEWWYVFIQFLFLIPMAYVLFYIGAWAQNDTYSNRKNIANGFAVTWILSIIANLIILFIVIFALEEFYETDEWKDEMHHKYGMHHGSYNHHGYGKNMHGMHDMGHGVYGNVVHGKDLVHGALHTYGLNHDYASPYYNSGPVHDDDHHRHLAENKTGQIKSNHVGYGHYGHYGTGHYGHDIEKAGYDFGYGYGMDGHHYEEKDDHDHEKDEVEDEIIVNFALLYGGFIIIYGFLGAYWWTVMRRWANLKMNEVMPYRGQGGMNDGDMSAGGGGYYDDGKM
jgi:hypothetical protein